MIDTLLSKYANKGGKTDNSSGEEKYVWYDINSEAYKSWKPEHDAWQKEYDAAESEYNRVSANNNMLLTSDEEKLIKFYDAIFSTIAEKGWSYNTQVNNSEYLNQMLQNNMYTITTVDRELKYDSYGRKTDYVNNYTTDVATNHYNVFTVSDTDMREDALAKYEYEKAIISSKETKIDTRMADLQTEQSSLKTMMEGIKSVMNENIERNFKIFA